MKSSLSRLRLTISGFVLTTMISFVAAQEIQPTPKNSPPTKPLPATQANPVQAPKANPLPTKTEPAKTDPTKPTPPQADPAKSATPKTDPTKTPAPQAKTPVPVGEAPKKDAPKETPKEAPKPVSEQVDWEKLKGEWISVRFEYEGKVTEARDRWTISFEKETTRIIGNPMLMVKDIMKWSGNAPTMLFWSGPVRLTATAKAKEIDIIIKGLVSERLQKGIYHLNGDNLTICWATGLDSIRPQYLTTEEESGLFLATFVRKPAKVTQK